MLERFRAALPREPVLVVPTPADAEHYQRELAAEGIVRRRRGRRPSLADPRDRGGHRHARPRALGLRRARARRARRRAGDAAPGAVPLGGRARLRRRRRRAVRRARPLARDARRGSPGAIRSWEDRTGARRASSPRCTRPTTGGLEALGSVDPEGLARAALDALRERPAAWGGRPVFLYGFDDLTPLQVDAVETLARHADVCVALAYEPGRAAFAGRAATVELLKPLAERHELLDDRSEHYAAAARRRAAPPRARPVRAGGRARAAQRRGPAAGGGRRARRGRARRRRRSSS